MDPKGAATNMCCNHYNHLQGTSFITSSTLMQSNKTTSRAVNQKMVRSISASQGQYV